MGDPRGFLTIRRVERRRLPVLERTRHWAEFYEPLPDDALQAQGARCMDCGVPFCQGDTGCPVRNVIPEWNDLVYRGRWREALDALHATNNFPEFTGRLCPAPCESACVLGLVDSPVTIRSIEQAIADRGFAEGWLTPRPPTRETGQRVAVVGSGPAGLAAAQQLRRSGHRVTVFERADRAGGLLRYGIPEFKLEKRVLAARLAQLEAEGVVFRTGVEVGRNLPAAALREEYDAVCLTMGATAARDLSVPGRELHGIHQAMEFLTQQNRRLEGDTIGVAAELSARGKRVAILGGGDTGSDVLGTCHRQGATEVWQFDVVPEPPRERAASTPWPLWPLQLRTSHAHEEGGHREWAVSTVAFVGTPDGRVRALRAVRVAWETDASGARRPVEVPGSAFELEVDLVILAMGFTGPSPSPLFEELGVRLDARGVVLTDDRQRTSAEGVFAAGDARRGASLIVWAIREGRDAAEEMNRYLSAR